MRRGIVIILIVVIAAFAGGFFYMDYQQEKETGQREGLKMGYLYGFDDAKAGNPLRTENLKERLGVLGDSTYDKAFLAGAQQGYLKGYAEGKESD